MAAPSQIGPISATGIGTPSHALPEAPAKAGVHKASGPAMTALVSNLGTVSELSVPLAVLGIVMAMILPMPSFLLDILISANITVSVIVLLVSIHITRPVEFSIFPTALLLLTPFSSGPEHFFDAFDPGPGQSRDAGSRRSD
ncbi:MAG: FHIPEP family type III secretion protein [Acidobacteriota bacterium]